MTTETLEIKITKTENSKINEVDFDNIPFGKVFTEVENNLSTNEKILFGLILKLRSKYGC